MSRIVLRQPIHNDKYTEFVYEQYDIQNRGESIVEIENNIRPDFDWKIGVIYGGSGSGKTTLLSQFGEIKKIKFKSNKALISNFDFTTPQDASLLLTSVGLSSVPVWLRSFKSLSNGEKYRARMAKLIGLSLTDETILIDEFTSVVDRDVAIAMSVSLSKYIRRTEKKVVLASCHYDIIEWLQPDWIYSPTKRRIERYECLRRRSLELSIFRCRYEAWEIFKQHHYLDHDLNPVCQCYLATLNNKPVAFIAVMPFPGVGDSKTRRISRIVVLPDYQGMGIGKKFVDYISSLYAANDAAMYIRTISPALGLSMLRDKNNWVETSSSMKVWTGKALEDPRNKMMNRPAYSFKYIGAKSNDSTNIITLNAEAYRDVSQNQLELFQ